MRLTGSSRELQPDTPKWLCEATSWQSIGGLTRPTEASEEDRQQSQLVGLQKSRLESLCDLIQGIKSRWYFDRFSLVP